MPGGGEETVPGQPKERADLLRGLMHNEVQESLEEVEMSKEAERLLPVSRVKHIMKASLTEEGPVSLIHECALTMSHLLQTMAKCVSRIAWGVNRERYTESSPTTCSIKLCDLVAATSSLSEFDFLQDITSHAMFEQMQQSKVEQQCSVPALGAHEPHVHGHVHMQQMQERLRQSVQHRQMLLMVQKREAMARQMLLKEQQKRNMDTNAMPIFTSLIEKNSGANLAPELMKKRQVDQMSGPIVLQEYKIQRTESKPLVVPVEASPQTVMTTVGADPSFNEKGVPQASWTNVLHGAQASHESTSCKEGGGFRRLARCDSSAFCAAHNVW